MKKNLPRITLVTPSYNQASYLPATIDSVLSQGYPDLEYFVMDGGSNDGSIDVIKRHAKHLSGWISERDKGQTDALNKGFARATGQVYAFINSDDLLEPGALRFVGELFATNACQWVASPVRCFSEVREWVYRAMPEQDPVDWLYQVPIPQQGCFWSADLWRRLGPFREDLHFAFDYEYWLRIRFTGDVRPMIVDRTLGAFRFHAASKTVSERARFEPEERAVRRQYRAYLPAASRLRAVMRERQALAN